MWKVKNDSYLSVLYRNFYLALHRRRGKGRMRRTRWGQREKGGENKEEERRTQGEIEGRSRSKKGI